MGQYYTVANMDKKETAEAAVITTAMIMTSWSARGVTALHRWKLQLIQRMSLAMRNFIRTLKNERVTYVRKNACHTGT